MKSVNTPDYVCRPCNIPTMNRVGVLAANAALERGDFRHDARPRARSVSFPLRIRADTSLSSAVFEFSRFRFFVNVESCGSTTTFFVLFSIREYTEPIGPGSAPSQYSVLKPVSIFAVMAQDFRC